MKKIWLWFSCFSLLWSCTSYRSFSKEKEIPFQAIFEEKKDHFIYFYKEDCSYCIAIKKEISDFFSQTEIPYFFIKDVPSSQFKKDYLSSIGARKSEDVYILGYPTLLLIENEMVTNMACGKSEILSYIASK